MKITRGDRAFGIINGLFLILIAAACLYPIIHVINGSFSDPLLLQSHTLFYGVSHWNSWFAAMIYLKDRSKYPLQLFLREMLVLQDGAGVTTEEEMLDENLKYATIVVATLPILFIYPFIQRYFVKGVMVGALKG